MQEPAPGLTLSDRFTLVHELGRGGMGTVWLAEDLQTCERVAIKILPADLTESADAIALLREEFSKASQLVHPNIVRVHEFLATDDGCLVSMQYIDGQTLGHRALKTFPEIVDCALSLCDSLEHAHRSGIVHRDIKPSNVLCDSAGRYFLTDFGVANRVSGSASVTRGGGSLPSMSPQQLDGEPATVTDDVYGLGALLYELLSGAPLFHPNPTPQRVRAEQPQALTVDQSGVEIPRVLQTLVSAMLDKSPDRRPAGIPAVRSVLEEVRVGDPDTAEAVIRPRARHARGATQHDGDPQPLQRIHPDKSGLPPPVVLAAFGVLVAIVAGVVFLLPVIVERQGPLLTDSDRRDVPESSESIEETATEDATVVDPAVIAEQRSRADAVLGELLTIQSRLRTIEVERWGADDWAEAVRLVELGDVAYRERDYPGALQSHRHALDRMRLIEARVPEVLARALRDGDEALLARDQDAAIRFFEIALAIKPAHAEAQYGLQRALRLDRVLDFVNRAADAERVGDWPAAESFFRQALELDSEWLPAIDGLDRVREAIARTAFETQMAAGFSAVQRQDHAGARQAFRSALKLRPGDAAALEALRQVDADLELTEIVTLRLAARVAESAEDWEEAARKYTKILAIDPRIEAINRDLQHARQRARLATDLDAEIARADRFYEDQVAEQAAALLGDARKIPDPRPKLAGQIERLDKMLRLAAIPVAVSFESDNLTDVVIYKVGRLGIFSARTVDLKPGTYVAVGTRDGYRDVRRTFRVVADGAMPPIFLSCEEPI